MKGAELGIPQPMKMWVHKPMKSTGDQKVGVFMSWADPKPSPTCLG